MDRAASDSSVSSLLWMVIQSGGQSSVVGSPAPESDFWFILYGENYGLLRIVRWRTTGECPFLLCLRSARRKRARPEHRRHGDHRLRHRHIAAAANPAATAVRIIVAIFVSRFQFCRVSDQRRPLPPRTLARGTVSHHRAAG